MKGTPEPPSHSPSTTLFGREIPSPIFVASGTGGHGGELGAFYDLRRIGGVVVKSLAAFAHEGNPAPRLAPLATGMMNSVGLPGPGVERWKSEYLPTLVSMGVRTVVSIWGRTVEEFVQAARQLEDVKASIIGVEINISCPNTERQGEMFGHSPGETKRVVEAVSRVLDLPLAAKISPNTDRYLEIVDAAISGGAGTIVAANTYLGQALAPGSSRGRLGRSEGGGVSGRGVHPLTLRIVSEIRRAFPKVELVGCGGVSRGVDAMDYLYVGANAVQVGTANFVDPRSTLKVAREVAEICGTLGVSDVGALFEMG